MHNFPISQEFLSRSAAVQVHNADEISHVALDLLMDDDKASTLGNNAKTIVEKNRGAVQKSIELIRGIIGTA